MSSDIRTRTCTILQPNEGPKYWLVGDHLTFKLGHEQSGGRFSFAEDTVQPNAGPPPHVHNREDEIFYVLEGNYTFTRGDRSFAAVAGDAVFLPRGTVHAFRNTGSLPGRVLIATTPSGFDRFVPDAGSPCVDAAEAIPPIDDAAIGKLLAACAKHGLEMKFDFKPNPSAEALAKGRELWVLGAHVRVKLTAADTNNQLSMVEVTCDPGAGVPPHAHVEMDEVFYVTRGTLEFVVNGDRVSAPAGTFVHVPPNVVHAFHNSGDVPASVVDYHLPGGFEEFFEACGTPCTDRANPPAFAPPDAATLTAVLAKYGMTMPA